MVSRSAQKFILLHRHEANHVAIFHHVRDHPFQRHLFYVEADVCITKIYESFQQGLREVQVRCS